MKILWSDKQSSATIRGLATQGVSASLARCIYASRLLGGQKDLVIHGGGNTSVKTSGYDLAQRKIDIMFVKASGHELDGIGPEGFTCLDLDRLRKLESLDVLDEGQMGDVLSLARHDPRSPKPSVESLMHAFLPATYVFHTHANALLALTNQSNGRELTEDLFGSDAIVLPYTMSGFSLAKRAIAAVKRSPDAKAVVVLKHGVFTFDDSAKEAYNMMTRLVTRARSRCKESHKQVFVTVDKIKKPMPIKELAPILRGSLLNSDKTCPGVILDFRTNHVIRTFLEGKDLKRYANAGPVTPDHVIWTKPKPLIISSDGSSSAIRRELKKYTDAYIRYFDKNNVRFGGDRVIREALPRVILVPGMGLFGVGETSKAASIVADLAETTVDVITAAEAIGRFCPVSSREIFDIEYWALESAKLNNRVAPPLQGRVAVITGGGSGIGKATAHLFRKAGAEVVILDARGKAAKEVAGNLGGLGLTVDIRDSALVRAAFNEVVLTYGGIDIVISNAGAAWEGEIGTVSDTILRDSFELNFFAHQTIAQNAVRVMRTQNIGGQIGGVILFNVSKQAINPGKNFGPYGTPKAATLFLVRQYALDHGRDSIRTGGVNADRIRSGLLNDEMITKRAKARGATKKGYMTGNLLGKEVTANDVAKAFLDLALSPATTGAVITVDGGNIEAALR